MKLSYSIAFTCLAAVVCAAFEPTSDGGVSQSTLPDAEAIAPYFDARSHTAEYVGPGRADPPPEGLGEIRIGWFGPSEPDHPTAGAMWATAQMAVDEANASGGYRGLDFRLVPAWSKDPWGTGIRDITRLIYDEGVWAIVGAPDGPSAHLGAQVVTKARLVFVSPVATDKTANLANVPWIFSCAPGDHLTAPVLANAILDSLDHSDSRQAVHPPFPTGEKGGATDNETSLNLGAEEEPPKTVASTTRRFALVSCTDHDSRMFVAELLAALEERRAFPSLHLRFPPGRDDFERQVESLQAAAPAAIALIAGPEDAARCLISLRAAGVDVPVFGDPRIGSRRFLDVAGPPGEGVTFPLLWDHSHNEPSTDFSRRFDARFGFAPDYTATHTYDAMNLLIAAIHRAGLNRARIRDAVRTLSPWSGVTGLTIWDPTGHNERAVRLGSVQNSRLSATDH